MSNEIQIPQGYRKDAKGNLVPEKAIKPIDLARDQLVGELVSKAKELHQLLVGYKRQAFEDIAAFIDLSAEEYNVKSGGKKGNVTLYTFDGQFKIQRAIQDSISFDERLLAAKALIDECLKSWTEGSRPELQALINNAFKVDQQGKISTSGVLALRRLDIKDERWLKAMQAISDAIQVVSSKAYIRIYERIGETDQYRPISLDIAGVPV
ncbi:DUF3164 family protein [Rheinheimera sp.]|uniref:DUF3164 family protein n=1 Tax=Rheinheimera sp. TaxID=1869214 RepID=UPI00307E96FE